MRQVSGLSGEQMSWRETSVGAHRQAWQEPEGPKASQWMGTSHTKSQHQWSQCPIPRKGALPYFFGGVSGET